MNGVAERLHIIQERLAAAARRAGREPSEVGLVAVSKTQPPERIQEAFDSGQRAFGENRVQELLAKAPLLPPSIRWHLIGHLQKNKIRRVLPLAEVIHGVDTLELAEAIDRVAAEEGLFPRVLLEVNVSGEGSKFGFQPDLLRAQLDTLLALPRVRVEGLMTIAPFAENPEEARPVFSALRRLRDELAARSGLSLPVLSMGMSGDFEVAIAEGATLVRVGTSIFGHRPSV
jgi:pyridoxal phosphate enzyme (YggS family)